MTTILILLLSAYLVREPDAMSRVAATWCWAVWGWVDRAAVGEAARRTLTALLAEGVADSLLPDRLVMRPARPTQAAPIWVRSLAKQTTV
jgi:hypothetical protein